MECYNQGYISLRLVILVILGHTDLRLRFRFTSRAAFCAVTSSKYCKSELSAASKYLNGEKKYFKSDLNGDLNGYDDNDDDKVGKLPLFYNYNYNYNYNYGNHFEHVFGPIRAMLAELEAFQNCYNLYLYLYLDGENVGMRGNHFRRVFEPIRAILAEIEGYQFFQNLSDKSDNAKSGCDELGSGPGNGNGNVDARSMSVLMSMSISISTDLVYKQKTGNGKHGKSKGNLYLYLYLEKQLIV